MSVSTSRGLCDRRLQPSYSVTNTQYFHTTQGSQKRKYQNSTYTSQKQWLPQKSETLFVNHPLLPLDQPSRYLCASVYSLRHQIGTPPSPVISVKK